MFGKRKKFEPEIVHEPTSTILARIKSYTPKEIPISTFEQQFFVALEDALHTEGLVAEYFGAERMGSGYIRVTCPAGIVGDVYLRKRFGCIQYFMSTYDSYVMDDAPVEAVIAVIPYWIQHIKRCISIYKKATTV